MNINNLVFSNSTSYRIKRHLLFWLPFYVYQVVRMSFLFPQDHLLENAKSILITSFFWGVFHNILISYAVVYYFIPKFYIKKKYVLFAVSLLLLYIFVFGLNFLYNIIYTTFTHAIGTTEQRPYIFLRGTLIRLLGNSPLVCGLLLSLKTLKTWHLKQKENEILTRENANAELQLLKAQIHPHFLFNTLNNIYSFTLNKSPEASALVEKLSDTLHYMITDCSTDLVLLEKELKMLENYIGLERVRYDERLEMWIDIKGDHCNKLIAPLIMIPFVENCFKHGTSMMRGNQWMQLVINIKGDQLNFTLINSKPPQPNLHKNNNGIGLANVKKRLQLLYPGKHHLNIEASDNTFSVQLQMELEHAENEINAYQVMN